ncbi:lamin tail domain-containing protein 2 [Ctenodactylus gundi]
MVPEPQQESEEEQVPPTFTVEEPVRNSFRSPAGTPTDTRAPSCSQDTKPHSTGEVSTNPQLAPEVLDPCTLQLLYNQQKLQIQSLRWAIQNGQHARHCHLLREVAGFPPERSYCAVNLTLNMLTPAQTWVGITELAPPPRSSHNQDTFLQNKVQELTLELKAQKEKAQLEKEHLEEKLMQTRAIVKQLEAELQVIQNWVGRMLRSQTSSVEVISAETLMSPSNFSENDQKPAVVKNFRLEDVDWNRIAHQYPSLFDTTISNSEQNGTSTLPGTGSGSSNLDVRSQVQRVIGHPPQETDFTSLEQIQVLAKSFSGNSEDFQRKHSHLVSQTLEPCANPDQLRVSSSLTIVEVNFREKFVRILNQSLEESVDLGGFVLQQLVHDFPVCMYRFPLHTLLKPQHHITVWGEGTRRIEKQPPSSLVQDSLQFHSRRGCVTVLLNAKGQVISKHQVPPDRIPGSGVYADNTDLSIDHFPLFKASRGTTTSKPQRSHRSPRKGKVQKAHMGHRGQRTGSLLPLLSTHKPVHPLEVSAWPEAPKLEKPDVLPPIPRERVPDPTSTLSHKEAVVNLRDCPSRKECQVRVCRKTVDRNFPMVALSVQTTAESRFGFRFLSCAPITVDTYRRV